MAAHMKIQVVDHGANPETVKDVAQGTPEYGSERQRLWPASGPLEPSGKQHDDPHRDGRQDQWTAGEPVREHAERHAFIETDPHSEKRCDRHRHAGRKTAQGDLLGGLVQSEGKSRCRQADGSRNVLDHDARIPR